MFAVETKNLCYAYSRHFWSRPRQALNGLCLEVGEGEIFGYLGANGAGKTTTIKLLVGLLRPQAGEARIFGMPVQDLASRRWVGFAPENPYFYEYLTAREALRFYAALCDVPAAERCRRADELLDFVGLREAADVRLREYSKGMRQRLGIAQALVHRPRLAILDEPQSGLDPVGRLQVREIILRLKEEGATVFFSTHILSDVEMICDRVGLLVRGRLQASGPLSTLLDARLKCVEMAIEAVPPACLETWRRRASRSQVDPAHAGRMLLTFPDEESANAAAREMLQAGGRLIAYRLQRETLEEYFMRTTGQALLETAAWSSEAER
ncbi:MAG: ABC transporter ATP-binding protein [Planctomycetota bacterium]|nr:ABC transporter ATP-binding protein [Planctomycetota bacterium]